MPPIILFGAEDGTERPVALGVKAPFVESMFDVGRTFAGIRVESRCVDEAEDSLAESGLVGCFAASFTVMLASGRREGQ